MKMKTVKCAYHKCHSPPFMVNEESNQRCCSRYCHDIIYKVSKREKAKRKLSPNDARLAAGYKEKREFYIEY